MATGDWAEPGAAILKMQDTTGRNDKSVGPNRYTVLGLALLVGGVLFAVAAWIILDYRPLAAAGISAAILGAVSLVLGGSLPRMSLDVGLILFEAGNENIGALVEEFGLNSKALYLPSSVSQGQPRAMIPLHSNSEKPVIRRSIDKRLLVQFGPGADDYGILVATPGSQVLSMIEGVGDGLAGDLESELSSVLVGRLNLADAVRTTRDGDVITIEVSRPALVPPRTLSYNVIDIIGSPVASIVAAIVAESLGRPVSVMSENPKGEWQVIEIELQSEVQM